MRQLVWTPEPYPQSGGLAAAGFYKLLGRPRLDPLTVLVRETAQNSWDARVPDQQVRYTIDGWSALLPEERDALSDVVFTEVAKSRTRVGDVLHERVVRALYISDRGTRGLGGPLLADRVSSSGTYDWVDFVLNVGKQNLQEQTGGTYGFGKTITYIVSLADAVVIHSRTMHRGRPQTRLIACAIGDEFEHAGRLHTGRHWWGSDTVGSPLPITGRDADRIAAAIGMPEFVDDELGTNVLILQPDFGGRTPEQAMQFVAESVTWHLWPKLMQHAHRRLAPMQVDVLFDGEHVPVPRPEDRPPLHGFAQAFRALLDDVDEGRRPDGLERTVIRSLRPKRDIGDLVTVPLVSRARADVDDGHDAANEDSPSPAASIVGVCHHVALLRAPELVVDYVAGPSPADGGTEWAAVFRSRPENDPHFAAAEPPTHDSWQPELLEKSAGKTIVKVALQRIREFLDERWGSRPDAVSASSSSSTAVVADALAGLVRAAPDKGAGRERGGGGGGGRPRQARVDILQTDVVLVDGEPATTAILRVYPKPGTDCTHLEVSVGVALDEGGSDPHLDPGLRLVSAAFDGTDLKLGGTTARLDLPGTSELDVELTIGRSAETAVQVDVRIGGSTT